MKVVVKIVNLEKRVRFNRCTRMVHKNLKQSQKQNTKL